MDVLVTGGAGFIGSHVVKALLERGDNIVVIDDMNSYYDVNLKEQRLAQFKDKITFYKIQLSDSNAVRNVFAHHHFDKICHLAAQAGVRYSMENPLVYNQSNVLGTLNILESMKEFDVKDLVFASSSSIYGGNKKIPFSVEDNVDQPISIYAATKRANELYAHVYHKLYGFNCFGLRFFTVYGPYGRPDMALFKFTKAILENKPIDVYNFGDHKRDFTYISDIVAGVIASLDKVAGYQILNLGHNNPVELKYFIECIEKELGKTARKNFLPMQKGDVHCTFADIEKTKSVLGWEPKVSIEQGIKEFIRWYMEYHGLSYQKSMCIASSVRCCEKYNQADFEGDAPSGDECRASEHTLIHRTRCYAHTQQENFNGQISTVAVVGLGYVGLPLAVRLSRHYNLVGFDVNKKRIADLKNGFDFSGDASPSDLKGINFTDISQDLKKAQFIIVCVPTPIDASKKPDLTYIRSSSQLVGENISKGAIVVYESTVYPGITEEVCVPIIEQASGLRCGEDFKIGYSPERINPGDKERTIDKITKIVSGMDKETLDQIDSVYSKITKTHRARDIKTAEAAKVIENIQRDLNIALVNELAIIFNKMNIDIYSVLEAAGTKWNFHKYLPGLVGGHCIGVDPYYLTYKAEELGYNPEVILAGRRINDNMHRFYVEKIVKKLSQIDKSKNDSGKKNVLILGLTFKPNVPDYRNSRIKHLIDELKEYNVDIKAYDPYLDKDMTEKNFSVCFFDPEKDLSSFDLIILAVEHEKLKPMLASELFPKDSLIRLKDLMV